MIRLKAFFPQSRLSDTASNLFKYIKCNVLSGMLLFFIVFVIFLTGCQKTKVTTHKKKSPIARSRKLYRDGQYEAAEQAFRLYLASTTASHTPALSQEAKFGVLLCRFLKGDAHWLDSARKWHYDARSYWEGKSFTILEGVAPTKKSYFKAIDRDAYTKCDVYAQFLVLRFLIWKHHFQFIERLVTQLKNDELAWKLCLLSAWSDLKKNNLLQSEKLFQIIRDCKTSYHDAKLEAQTGLAIIAFLDHAEIPDRDYTNYCIELQQIKFYRFRSPFAGCKQQILRLPQKQLSTLVLCDMIFNFAGVAEHPPRIWKAGLSFMTKHKPSFLPKIYYLFHDRFILALAWWDLIHGREKAARSFFQILLKKTNGVSSYKKESALALALMDWKEDSSLDDLVKKLRSYSWTDQYTLAGKVFDFYRLPSRDSQKAILKKLRKTICHKIYFTMLDVLCLLGDGRSAYAFLGQVVEKFPEDTQSVYLTEEKNIPRNPYAENQIWEKLD